MLLTGANSHQLLQILKPHMGSHLVLQCMDIVGCVTLSHNWPDFKWPPGQSQTNKSWCWSKVQVKVIRNLWGSRLDDTITWLEDTVCFVDCMLIECFYLILVVKCMLLVLIGFWQTFSVELQSVINDCKLVIYYSVVNVVSLCLSIQKLLHYT